ncbi:MAG: ATP-binding protein [Gammaproteobacteria bacterium]|nr:ATP-binding protein [Gammaproteobacteria bacterium]
MIHSLALRLLLLLMLSIIITTSIAISISHHESQHEIQELFDAQLAQSARIVEASFLSSNSHPDIMHQQTRIDNTAQHEDTNEDDNINLIGHVYERKVAFQIWDKNQNLILYSSTAPDSPLSENNQTGFQDILINKEQWRVFSLWTDDGEYLIETAENYEVRNELADEISAQLISTSLLSIPVLIFVILFAVNQGLKPLNKIADQVQHRQPDYLGTIENKNTPNEIRPLVNSLNTLFERVTRTLEMERRFTDDAAHELRTPLAAIKTQAQVALRSDQEGEKHQALQQIVHGVDRLTHLVQQLLTLARIGQGEMKVSTECIALYPLTADVIAGLTHKSIDKQIELSLEGDEEIITYSNRITLEMLLRNIIDNAITYTPTQGHVNITITSKGQRPCIQVSDNGPGIAPEFHDKIFERFYRINSSDQPGCGLGMAIAKQCANLLNAQISLTASKQKQGLTVSICFNDND